MAYNSTKIVLLMLKIKPDIYYIKVGNFKMPL